MREYVKLLAEPGRESTIERFIGALTMALGIGALIPRSGYGLYALLEESGQRGFWAMLMLSVGVWMVVASYLKVTSIIRVVILCTGIVFWAMLVQKFISAYLWGAAIQGMVIITFAIDTLCRLYAKNKQSDGKKH